MAEHTSVGDGVFDVPFPGFAEVFPISALPAAALIRYDFTVPLYLRPKSRPAGGPAPKRACGRSPRGRLTGNTENMLCVSRETSPLHFL